MSLVPMLKLAMVILVVVVAMSTLATAHTELVCDVFHRLGYLPSTSMFISGRFLYVFNDQQYFRVPTGDLNPTGGVLMNLRGVQFQPIPVPNFGKHIAIIDYIQEHVLNGFGHHILLRTFNDKYLVTMVKEDIFNTSGQSYTHLLAMYEEFFETREASTMLNKDGTEGLWCFKCDQDRVCYVDAKTFFLKVIRGIAQNPTIRSKEFYFYQSHPDFSSYRYSNSTKLVGKYIHQLRLQQFVSKKEYYPKQLPRGFIYQGYLFVAETQRPTLVSYKYSTFRANENNLRTPNIPDAEYHVRDMCPPYRSKGTTATPVQEKKTSNTDSGVITTTQAQGKWWAGAKTMVLSSIGPLVLFGLLLYCFFRRCVFVESTIVMPKRFFSKFKLKPTSKSTKNVSSKSTKNVSSDTTTRLTPSITSAAKAAKKSNKKTTSISKTNINEGRG